MRKDLLALGLIVTFAGLIFLAFSQVAIVPEPIRNWIDVTRSVPEQPSYNMSVQGNFTIGDRLRVYFQFPFSGGLIREGAAVLANLTDPSGHIKASEVPVGSTDGQIGIMAAFPEYLANFTGTYRVKAEGLGVSLASLALQRLEIEQAEPYYPNGVFLPAGGAVFAGGLGTSILGAKISKRRRRSSKYKR